MADLTIVDVAVVGAGISGLAVAEGLLRAGRTVRVLEARDHVGGRMESVEVAGGFADMGPTWFWPGEERVAQLVQSHEIGVHQQWNAGSALLMTGGTSDRLAYQSPPAYRFVGGAASLVHAMADSLPTEVVSLGTIVRRVESTTDGVVVHGDTTFDGPIQVAASAVVVALPPALALGSGLVQSESLDPAVAHVATQIPVWMGGITKAVAVYDRPFWRDLGLSGLASCPGEAFGEIHDMAGPDGQPAMLFGFGTSNPNGDALTAEVFVQQLNVLFGPEAASPQHVLVRDWQQDPLTTPDHWPLSGRYELFGARELQTPSWDGRLFWCSTETASRAPGHIEGALQAAERTVQQLTAAAPGTQQ